MAFSLLLKVSRGKKKYCLNHQAGNNFFILLGKQAFEFSYLNSNTHI